MSSERELSAVGAAVNSPNILPFTCSLRKAGGNPGRDQIRPALPSMTYTADGRHNSRKLAHALTCPGRLGWAGEELLCLWREGEADVPSSQVLAGQTPLGDPWPAIKQASVGLRVASGAGTVAGRVLGTNSGVGITVEADRPWTWTAEDGEISVSMDLAGDGRDGARGGGPRQH